MTAAASGVNQVVSGTTPLPAGSSGSTSGTLAANFQTFLTLLTTQLQNQNPLDPLDTNQFTQQLVQFASVEQQLKTNDQLSTLVSLQQTTQSTQALGFVGKTAVVDGSAAAMSNSQAAWLLDVPKDSTVNISITNSAGQTVYSKDYAISAGDGQSFTWDGKGNDGTQWPAGYYTINASGKDTAGNNIGIPSEVQGVVDSVDLTASPPLLSVGGQTYTTDQIKRVVRPGAA